jgi:hypothetical protein
LNTQNVKPLVYLILGAAGSGRREMVADLIDGGLAAGAKPAVLLAADEPASELDQNLPGLARWKWTGEAIDAALPPDATQVFFMTQGRANPVEQVDVFKPWLEAQGGELARVISVVNCALAEKNPPLLAWYEACVHFSDIVLLNRREGVANKWLSDFLAYFQDQFYPCLFEQVKGGRVKNPALVLEPQARRLSHWFDEEQDWIFTNADGEEIDEEEVTEDDEEIEATPAEDLYLARDAAGRRAKRIPDIAKFLGA